jgi:hypothetical protein
VVLEPEAALMPALAFTFDEATCGDFLIRLCG